LGQHEQENCTLLTGVRSKYAVCGDRLRQFADVFQVLQQLSVITQFGSEQNPSSFQRQRRGEK